MKKSLVLAMAMALGVSATAFAANPFSDVPAGHWAYGSVSKLAAAGIVDGYPDGTFKGDNLMTRYEMAQIVAKAYAKGAIGADDKLMAEFADELDNLGVRVAKLEKKADNVKITGEARFGYKDIEYRWHNAKDNIAELRTRLYVSGAINDDWSYGAMIQNTQTLDTNAEEANTAFRRAFVKGEFDGVKITAGRQAFTIGEGYTADLTGDAIKVDFGKVLKATAFFGRFDDTVDSLFYPDSSNPANYWWWTGRNANEKADTYGVALDYDFGKAKTRAAYYNTKAGIDENDRNIYTMGLGYGFDKNVNVYAEYLKSDKNLGEIYGGYAGFSDDGWAATVNYKGAKTAVKGSWGAHASYYDQAGATIIDHISEAENMFNALYGFKGYEVGADYTFAKNIVGSISYYDFDYKDIFDSAADKMLWPRVTFTF